MTNRETTVQSPMLSPLMQKKGKKPANGRSGIIPAIFAQLLLQSKVLPEAKQPESGLPIPAHPGLQSSNLLGAGSPHTMKQNADMSGQLESKHRTKTARKHWSAMQRILSRGHRPTASSTPFSVAETKVQSVMKDHKAENKIPVKSENSSEKVSDIKEVASSNTRNRAVRKTTSMFRHVVATKTPNRRATDFSKTGVESAGADTGKNSAIARQAGEKEFHFSGTAKSTGIGLPVQPKTGEAVSMTVMEAESRYGAKKNRDVKRAKGMAKRANAKTPSSSSVRLTDPEQKGQPPITVRDRQKMSRMRQPEKQILRETENGGQENRARHTNNQPPFELIGLDGIVKSRASKENKRLRTTKAKIQQASRESIAVDSQRQSDARVPQTNQTRVLNPQAESEANQSANGKRQSTFAEKQAMAETSGGQQNSTLAFSGAAFEVSAMKNANGGNSSSLPAHTVRMFEENISKSLKLLQHGKDSQVTFRARTPDLGVVKISTRHRQRKLEIEIRVQNNQVKEVLERALPNLKQSLLQNHATVSTMHVVVDDHLRDDLYRGHRSQRRLKEQKKKREPVEEIAGSRNRGDAPPLAARSGWSTYETVA